jgi:hypothetical protein
VDESELPQEEEMMPVTGTSSRGSNSTDTAESAQEPPTGLQCSCCVSSTFEGPGPVPGVHTVDKAESIPDFRDIDVWKSLMIQKLDKQRICGRCVVGEREGSRVGAGRA